MEWQQPTNSPHSQTQAHWRHDAKLWLIKKFQLSGHAQLADSRVGVKLSVVVTLFIETCAAWKEIQFRNFCISCWRTWSVSNNKESEGSQNRVCPGLLKINPNIILNAKSLLQILNIQEYRFLTPNLREPFLRRKWHWPMKTVSAERPKQCNTYLKWQSLELSKKNSKKCSERSSLQSKTKGIDCYCCPRFGIPISSAVKFWCKQTQFAHEYAQNYSTDWPTTKLVRHVSGQSPEVCLSMHCRGHSEPPLRHRINCINTELPAVRS